MVSAAVALLPVVKVSRGTTATTSAATALHYSLLFPLLAASSCARVKVSSSLRSEMRLLLLSLLPLANSHCSYWRRFSSPLHSLAL